MSKEKMTKTIFESLIDFQSEIQAVSKTETAKLKGTTKAGKPYDMSYSYATLDSIQKAIQPLLYKHGLAYTQSIVDGGLMTTLYNAQGDKLESGAIPLILTGKPQERGSEITYARRYSLTSFLGLIVEDEDDDGNKANEQPKQEWNAKNTVWLTEEQYKKLVDMAQKGENIQGIHATIKKYSGQVIDGVKYMMKKEFKEKLKEILN
jgi:hypothetical protein